MLKSYVLAPLANDATGTHDPTLGGRIRRKEEERNRDPIKSILGREALYSLYVAGFYLR